MLDRFVYRGGCKDSGNVLLIFSTKREKINGLVCGVGY